MSCILRNVLENRAQQNLKMCTAMMFSLGRFSPVSMHWSTLAASNTSHNLIWASSTAISLTSLTFVGTFQLLFKIPSFVWCSPLAFWILNQRPCNNFLKATFQLHNTQPCSQIIYFFSEICICMHNDNVTCLSKQAEKLSLSASSSLCTSSLRSVCMHNDNVTCLSKQAEKLSLSASHTFSNIYIVPALLLTYRCGNDNAAATQKQGSQTSAEQGWYLVFQKQ